MVEQMAVLHQPRYPKYRILKDRTHGRSKPSGVILACRWAVDGGRCWNECLEGAEQLFTLIYVSHTAFSHLGLVFHTQVNP